jgi:3-dehydroquinate synthetase/shikimate kinase
MSATITTTFMPAPPLPAGRLNLVFTGFMGTGKTTAGREAARTLGMPFVDLDRVIERRAGRPLPDLFAVEGESAFRGMERRVLSDAARVSGMVIATGGGAVLHEQEFASLAGTAEVAVLTADPEVLTRRVRSGQGRPLLSGAGDVEASMRSILDARADRYAAAGAALDTSHAIRGAAAAEATRRYSARAGAGLPVVRVDVDGPAGRYPVAIGRGAIGSLETDLPTRLPDAATIAVVAEATASSIADDIGARLARCGLRTVAVRVAGGELGKRMDTVSSLWDAFRNGGIGRRDAVVAVGGGATLDTIGFAAATFARGVPLVNVPTTLLAMVDASLGGKVGVDHGDTKNLVGAFHHPSLVVADPSVLGSLPRRLLLHGIAEAVKEAVLASPLVLDVLAAVAEDDHPPAARNGSQHSPFSSDELVDWLVEQAVRIKAAYVAADPLDRDVRRSLNLGHTFAHAIESASGYAIPHGEAVSMGLVASATLGERLGVTREGTATRLRALLRRLGLPVAAPAGLSPDAMVAAIGADKKRRAGASVFVVPADGGAAAVEGLDPVEALGALDVEGASTRP